MTTPSDPGVPLSASPTSPSPDAPMEAILPRHDDIWTQTLGWQPSDRQYDQFQQLYHHICTANRTLNLTRITAPDDFWEKHLWDSISGIYPFLTANDELTSALSPETAPSESTPPEDSALGDTPSENTLPNPSIQSVLDIGTGGGFPGLPVAIANPHWSVTLLDSTRKKIAFIQSILASLGLTNVTAIADRAEGLGRNSRHRYQYDVVLIRAVAAAEVCAEYVLPFLKVGGQGVLYRGRWSEEEEAKLAEALEMLGGAIELVYAWETPLSGSDRHCIVLRKTAKTPRLFPRAVGVPAKHPLV